MSTTKTAASWAKAVALALALAFAAMLALAGAPAANADEGAPGIKAGLVAQEASTGVAGEGVTWSLEDGVLTVTGEEGKTIPVFSSWTNAPGDFTKLVIEGNNVSIADRAFMRNASIETLVLPKGVRLGYQAFAGCSSLKEIVFPEYVSSYSANGNVFPQCSALESVIVPGALKSDPVVTQWDYDLYRNIDANNLFIKCLGLKSVVIAEGTDGVGEPSGNGANFLKDCSNLENVTFPASLRYLSSSTFNNNNAANLKWARFKGNLPNPSFDWFSQAPDTMTVYCPEEQVSMFRANLTSSTIVGVPKAVADAEAALEALSDAADVTIADEQDINAARQLYNTAVITQDVDDTMKSWLDVNKLTAAEAALASLDPLAGAKDAAKAELAAYKSASAYREAQAAELAAAIESGNAAIDAAETEEAVSSALADAKAAIDLIKTNAQMTAAEQAAEDAIAAIDAENPTAEQVAAAREAYDALDATQKTPALEAPILRAELAVAKAEAGAAAAQAELDKQAAADAAAKAEAAKYEGYSSPEQVKAAEDKASKDAADKAAKAEAAKYAGYKSPAQVAAAEKAAADKAKSDAAASAVKANTLKAAPKAKVLKAKAKKATTFKKAKAFKVTGAKGKVTFAKLSGNAKISVSAKGKVKVAKGLKAGKTYKVKVLVAAAGGKVKSVQYAPAVKTVTLKVKVKK